LGLAQFHQATQQWFGKALGEATAPQEDGWTSIGQGQNTLIAAPTGSGKTLAAFLSAIDGLARASLEGPLPDECRVLYVSPLKALSNDIHRNLQVPLMGIDEELEAMGLGQTGIRVGLRTGDTPSSQRAAAKKAPPHIYVTTPESLYILLTSKGGRNILKTVRTVIVDEIHAMVWDKRGSHLALSLERLQALTGHRLQRIGLSATQKPLEKVAQFLGGGDCHIVDAGHARALDLALELPSSPLEAVMAGEVWDEIYDRLAQLVEEHDTTLVFVNTRRLAERVAKHLSDRLGKEHVSSHHGSLAKEQRLDAEGRLKEGTLRALVATASLELGIDIGSVDLVCQLGSTRSIATFLQRVGRSGHAVRGLPKGRLFPLSRDELVESIAMLDAVRRGELDAIVMPEAPLDILAQQVVAAVAMEDWKEAELLAMFQKAYPYRDLTQAQFSDVLQMLSDGYATRAGRRGALIHRDRVAGQVRARRASALTAVTSGGAIPEVADYQVIQEPMGMPVGTVNEDFAIESLPGDIFQLGTASWKILKVEPGKLRVADARGAPPSIPFWLGEAPGRTVELSFAVSRLREGIDARLGDLDATDGVGSVDSALPGQAEAIGVAQDAPVLPQVAVPEWAQEAVAWLTDDVGVDAEAAWQGVNYLAMARKTLGVIPTQGTIVLERFFDESGGMQMVIHSIHGSRLNRAWGLALRKRFCRTFNFELQAAATEDAIILSLGLSHSFPAEEAFRFLHSGSVRDVLIQALLDSPMFEARWRWNATRSLAVVRWQGGKKVPPPLQRMRADDLLSTIFPDSKACLENIAGDREVPDHPLVQQTVGDCLFEAMDIDALEAVLGDWPKASGNPRPWPRRSSAPGPTLFWTTHLWKSGESRPWRVAGSWTRSRRRIWELWTRRLLTGFVTRHGPTLAAPTSSTRP
jgi:ATP-dependent Lhr-like helicase